MSSSATSIGQIDIGICYERGQVVSVDIASKRPQAARALVGRSCDEALALVPLLFSVCGRAQSAAARLAVMAGRGEQCAPHFDPVIALEVMREHLWRWLIDLPPLLDCPQLSNEFSSAIRALNEEGGRPLSLLLLSNPVKELRDRLDSIAQPLTADTLLLHMLSATDSLRAWPELTECLCQTPIWNGFTAETGTYARRANGTRSGREKSAGEFSVRWLARLAELTELAAGRRETGCGGTTSATPIAPKTGRSLVETARGLLMHEVEIDNDKIVSYRIVAPTEWNFHPQGTLSRWLVGRSFVTETALRNFVALAVATLDPCVSWKMSLNPPISH